jgi:hypothetical protein
MHRGDDAGARKPDDAFGERKPASRPPEQIKQPSWRDWRPVHPAAEMFPLVSPDALEELAEDIGNSGLRSVCAFIRDDD